MKKALIVASVGVFFGFEKNDIEILLDLGYEVHCASNFTFYNGNLDSLRVKKYEIPFERNPFKTNNIRAYMELKKLIMKNEYTLIHCHTPVGGAITRLVKRRLKLSKEKIVYTAHGFHFYTGAPKFNWAIYYPIEKWLSRYTDVLITINNEDFDRSKQYFDARKIIKVPGVGIDLKKMQLQDFNQQLFRRKLDVGDDDVMILSVGELNKNKNHEIIIKSMALLNYENLHYFIAGRGNEKDALVDLAKKLNLEDHVHFLGYRKDIAELCNSTDIFALPSKREGLSVALMEAMSCGKICIASNIRGNKDLLESDHREFLIENNVDDCAEKMNCAILSLKEGGVDNTYNLQPFCIETISKKMREVYANF